MIQLVSCLRCFSQVNGEMGLDLHAAKGECRVPPIASLSYKQKSGLVLRAMDRDRRGWNEVLRKT